MALRIEVSVLPSSGRQKIFLDAQGRLKCHLKNQPEKGKANSELTMLFAKSLGITRASVEIIGGATSRKKVLLIHGVATLDDLYERLEIEKQKALF